MSITNPPKTRLATRKEIEDQITANEHLLSLYSSPFPDGIERRKRKELKEHIALLRYELKARNELR